MTDEGGENAVTDESDQFLKSILRNSNEIQAKVRSVEDSVDQLRAATAPYVELAGSLRRLAERDQQQRRTIAQLRAQNQALQTEKNVMAESLSKAINEKKSLEDVLDAIKTEKGNLQTHVNTLIREREALLKTQADTAQQISSMRAEQHKLISEITTLEADLRAQNNRIGELQHQLSEERTHHRYLQEQIEREAAKRMEDQRTEFVRQQTHKMEAEVQEYEMKHRQMKKTFESALKEAELETKKLAAERNEWFAKYNQLASELEEKKRRLNADVQRLLSEKWREMMRSFNLQQASQNARDANLMIRRPENLASKFMQELIGSSASDSSVFGNDEKDVPENTENIPPVSRGSRKRSASASLTGRHPLIKDVVGKVVSSHANPRTFQSKKKQ